MASYQYVYHMQGLSKAYPGGKKVLDNIHLSFYPGAKIGVLGVNGAGKSTLLRIMAGTDKEWTGEAWAADGARVGYLPQEPQLDPTKNVRENVMEGVAAQKAILDRYNELAMNYSDETADEMTKSKPKGFGISTPKSIRRWMRCAARPTIGMSLNCPAARSAASRSASFSWRNLTFCCSTNRPTILMPRR
jgi:ATPase subunit of ABC transporter with duplicated ATPase domains